MDRQIYASMCITTFCRHSCSWFGVYAHALPDLDACARQRQVEHSTQTPVRHTQPDAPVMDTEVGEGVVSRHLTHMYGGVRVHIRLYVRRHEGVVVAGQTHVQEGVVLREHGDIQGVAADPVWYHHHDPAFIRHVERASVWQVGVGPGAEPRHVLKCQDGVLLRPCGHIRVSHRNNTAALDRAHGPAHPHRDEQQHKHLLLPHHLPVANWVSDPAHQVVGVLPRNHHYVPICQHVHDDVGVSPQVSQRIQELLRLCCCALDACQGDDDGHLGGAEHAEQRAPEWHDGVDHVGQHACVHLLCCVGVYLEPRTRSGLPNAYDDVCAAGHAGKSSTIK